MNVAAAVGRVAKARGCREAVFPSRPNVMGPQPRAMEVEERIHERSMWEVGWAALWERVKGVSNDPQVSVQGCPH